MEKREPADRKTVALKGKGALNARAETVVDALFQENSFFDPTDILQVRYEMLRRHHYEGEPIVDVATAFGVSRPTFYQSQAAFNESGLSGLLPKQRGSKGGYKISSQVVEYVRSLRESNPALTTMECVQSVNQRFGIAIHRRSLERALGRSQKNNESNGKPFVSKDAAPKSGATPHVAPIRTTKAKSDAIGSVSRLPSARTA